MIDLANEYKKRPRAFMGAGIIALSFIAAVAISHAANRSVLVWSLRISEPAGTVLVPAMLQPAPVYLPKSLGRYLPISEKIDSQALTVGVGAGELIARGALAPASQSNDHSQLPLKIGKSDLPIDLRADEIVDLYLVPGKEGALTTGSALVVARGLRVISVDNRSRDLGGDVGLLIAINESAISDLLTKANGGRIVVVRHGR